MNAKPSVMQLCLTLDTGGLERVVVNLASALARNHGVASRICTVGQTKDKLISAAIGPGTVWTELKGPPHFSFRTALKLAREVKRHKIDLIHAHGTQPLVYALTSALLCGVPVVYTKHNSYEDLNFFLRRGLFNKLACLLVRRFIGVSDPATEILRRVFRPAAERCVTQINGTELPSNSVRCKASAIRNSGSMLGPQVIATVCRLAPEKDIATLLHAFARVQTVHPHTELWIVGDGAERQTLLQLADKLNIRRQVRFWGFRGKIQQILACSDLFVNSSLTEGISISILEAMSLGLPVVATAVGGTPSIVTPENGLLVPPKQPDQLADAMLTLLCDADLRRRMGEQSFQSVKSRWSLDQMAESYLRLYGLTNQLPDAQAA